MKKLYMGRDSRGANLYRIETDRGAFVRYEIENRRACVRSLVETWAPRLLIAAFVLFVVLFGLPGDPLHGASKYQPKIGPAVTREQSPAFLRNSNGRLDFPGPTQEAS